METKAKTTAKTDVKTFANQQVKKLSKIGEWLESGKSIIASYDMKAILR